MKNDLFNLLLVLILAFFLLLSSRIVYAGGGRMSIESAGTGTAGGSIAVKVLMHKPSPNSQDLSIGERAQFIVNSPRDGDRCDTNPAASDSQGYVYGTCYASQPGTITIHVHSLDQSDDSSDYLLTFIAGPTPTSTPTLTPTPTSKLTTSETPTEEPTPTDEVVAGDETPTPSPEAKVAGFFSNPLSWIVILIVLIFLGAGGYILWKEKKFPFNKFALKKINKPDVPESPPVEQSS